MSKVLVIAEHDNQQLADATLHVVTAGFKFSEQVDILVAGYNCNKVVDKSQRINNVRTVLVADAKIYEHFLAESVADLIKHISDEYDYILAPATTFGKNILPRVAGLLEFEMVSDVVDILSADTFNRYIYAGNALATVQVSMPKKLLTIRPTMFVPCSHGERICDVSMVDYISTQEQAQFIGLEKSAASELPDLQNAKIVISGGRGVQNKEGFALLESLAKELHAALGASRAAVDAGLVPNDWQIGQTGKVVAPQLYIAVGISGAIQHVAGMKDSKIVVAINTDPNAPIFQIADYGLVADFKLAIPEMLKLINN